MEETKEVDGEIKEKRERKMRKEKREGKGDMMERTNGSERDGEEETKDGGEGEEKSSHGINHENPW